MSRDSISALFESLSSVSSGYMVFLWLLYDVVYGLGGEQDIKTKMGGAMSCWLKEWAWPRGRRAGIAIRVKKGVI